MNRAIILQKLLGVMAILVLAGCAGSATPSPIPLPTFPPPSPTAVQPIQSPEQLSLLKYVKSVQITQDGQFNTGGFVQVFYVDATDRLIVTFVATSPSGAAGDCAKKAVAYKEYTLDMEPTGVSRLLFCGLMTDITSLMVDNAYYLALMAMDEAGDRGWHIIKYDAITWDKLTEFFHPVQIGPSDPACGDNPNCEQIPKGTGGPTMAYVNGQLVVTSGFRLSPEEPNQDTPPGTYGTHHQFFSINLEYLGEQILTAPPHVAGSALFFLDGVYYLVTSNLYEGDMLLATYGKDWNYLGGKTLIEQANSVESMGSLVFDGKRFYLAYFDSSQRINSSYFPPFPNIHMAIFDRDWNILEDVAVTNYTPQDNMMPGRPSVSLHGNHLYISYDLDTRDPVTHEQQMQFQAYVSIYELPQQP